MTPGSVVASAVAGLLLGYGGARLWASRPYESRAVVRFVAPRVIGPELTRVDSLGVPREWLSGCTHGSAVYTSLRVEGTERLQIRSSGKDARAAQCLAATFAAWIMTMDQPRKCCAESLGSSILRDQLRGAETRLATLRRERETAAIRREDVGPVERAIDSEVERRDKLTAIVRAAEVAEARESKELKRTGYAEFVDYGGVVCRHGARMAPRSCYPRGVIVVDIPVVQE